MSDAFDTYLGSPARRRLLRAAPGSLAWALAGGLMGHTHLASAQPMAEGAPPQVDRLAVRVVTDSYHHAFEPTRTLRDLRIQRYAFGLRKDAEPRTLLNEWGLSLHLESARGAEVRQVLIDFGYTAPTLNQNLELLGIDVGRLDALALSHGHYDHFGGLVGFLQAQRGRLRPDTPFVLRCIAVARSSSPWRCRNWATRWCVRPPARGSSSARPDALAPAARLGRGPRKGQCLTLPPGGR